MRLIKYRPRGTLGGEGETEDSTPAKRLKCTICIVKTDILRQMHSLPKGI